MTLHLCKDVHFIPPLKMVELFGGHQAPLMVEVDQIIAYFAGSPGHFLRHLAKLNTVVVLDSLHNWLKSISVIFVELLTGELFEMSFHHGFFSCLFSQEINAFLSLTVLLSTSLDAANNLFVPWLQRLE